MRLRCAIYRDPLQLLLAKDDARLREVVRRQLDLDFVAGHDPNEVLPHLARNVSEHVAVSREVDAEHRARQDLCDGPFRDDLLLLRHAASIANECKFSTARVPAAIRENPEALPRVTIR